MIKGDLKMKTMRDFFSILCCLMLLTLSSCLKVDTLNPAIKTSLSSSAALSALNAHYSSSDYVYTLNQTINLTPIFDSAVASNLTFTVQPDLPNGLTLNTTTAAITGTCKSISPQTNYTITIADANSQTTSFQVSLTINDITPAGLAYPNSNVLTATKNIALSNIIPSGNTGGDVTSFSLDTSSQTLFASLGLTFNTLTGAITGTPQTVLAATTLKITATNSGGSQVISVSLAVLDVAPSGITYPNLNILNSTKGSVILLAPTAGTGGAATLFTFSASSGTIMSALGLNLNPLTGVISGTLLTTQTNTLVTVVASNTIGSQTLSLSITVADAIPSGITYPTSNTLVATTGIASSFAPSSSLGGTPTSYSITPALSTAGLNFSTSTGIISGTPTASLISTQYTVLATNVSGAQSITIYLAVNPAAINGVIYNSNNMITGTVGSAFSYTPSGGTGGAPTSYSISGSQNATLTSAGLSFNTSTGAITGTSSGAPTSALNNFVLAVTAINSSSSYTIPITITIGAVNPSTISYPSNGAMVAIKGAAFSFAPTVNSGGTPSSYTIPASISSILTAANVSFSTSTGIFSATTSPATTVLATTTFSILASNSGGSVLVNASLTINDAAPASVSYASATNALSVTAGAGGSFSPAAGSGGTAVSYSFNPAGFAASLTYGLTLNSSTGVITVPTSANTDVNAASFGVIATNSGGSQTISPITLTINATGVSITNSSVVATPASVLANGTTPVTVTVTLKDTFGNPISATKSVTLTSSRGSADTIAVSPLSTNSAGQAVFSVTSTSVTVGSATSTFTAVDTTDSTTASAPSNPVTFTAGPAIVLAISGGNNQSIAAGGTVSPLSVRVTDASNNPVSGQVVGWSITSGSGQLPQITSITNASGVATLSGTPFILTTASTNGSGSVITASIGGTTTTVAFNTTVTVGAPSLNYSTLASSVTSLPPDNSTTGTLTATIKDAYDNPIANNVVTFSTSGYVTPTLSSSTATTNSSGLASITLKGATSGIATISAATSGTVINLTPIELQWVSAPSLSTTQSTYWFATANSPTINVTNTGSALSSCTITPALPSSLSFNTTTCAISPVAGVVGSPLRGAYTITGYNPAGQSSVNITIAAFFSTSYGDGGSTVCWWDASGVFKCCNSGASSGSYSSPNYIAAVNSPVSVQGANTVSAFMNNFLITTTGAVYQVSGSSYALVSGLTSGYTQVAQTTGEWASVTYCAVKASGGLMCWGSLSSSWGPYYELGTNGSAGSPTAMNMTSNITALAGGNCHYCAIISDGTIKCWGSLFSDVNGNGPSVMWSSNGNPAVTIPGVTNPVQISCGGAWCCAVAAAGTLGCFGNNIASTLGTGGGSNTSTFGSTGLIQVVQVATMYEGFSKSLWGQPGAGTTCAIFQNQSVSCWGSSVGGSTASSIPLSLSAITNAVAIYGYNGGFCTLLSTGHLQCWGSGISVSSPTLITGFP